MEQESHKREVEETSYQTPNSPTLCANNCGFFGTAATNNFCSKCYKDFFLKQSKASLALVENEIDKPIIGKVIEEDQVTNTTILNEEGASSKNPGDRPANRCSLCRKRVGLTGFKCRCDQLFCSLHRYTDKHNCVFDYKTAAQDAITKANPVVKADKIEKI